MGRQVTSGPTARGYVLAVPSKQVERGRTRDLFSFPGLNRHHDPFLNHVRLYSDPASATYTAAETETEPSNPVSLSY